MKYFLIATLLFSLNASGQKLSKPIKDTDSLFVIGNTFITASWGYSSYINGLGTNYYFDTAGRRTVHKWVIMDSVKGLVAYMDTADNWVINDTAATLRQLLKGVIFYNDLINKRNDEIQSIYRKNYVINKKRYDAMIKRMDEKINSALKK